MQNKGRFRTSFLIFTKFDFVLSNSIMKPMKRLLLILLLLVVGLIIFSFVQLILDSENPIQISLNLLYYFSLLLALLGLRFSLIGNQRWHPIVVVLTFLLIGLATWEWFNPQAILDLGHFSLGLFALQFGLVLMLLVKTEGKGSKAVQLVLGITSVVIASLAFLKLENEMIYTLGGGLMALSTLTTLIFLFSRKTS